MSVSYDDLLVAQLWLADYNAANDDNAVLTMAADGVWKVVSTKTGNVLNTLVNGSPATAETLEDLVELLEADQN